MKSSNKNLIRHLQRLTRRKFSPENEQIIDEVSERLGLQSGPGDWTLPPGDQATTEMISVMNWYPVELRRLDDYERRAISRRKRALRRLDYERIEAERRHSQCHKGQGPGE
jgi:hypothetical protein